MKYERTNSIFVPSPYTNTVYCYAQLAPLPPCINPSVFVNLYTPPLLTSDNTVTMPTAEKTRIWQNVLIDNVDHTVDYESVLPKKKKTKTNRKISSIVVVNTTHPPTVLYIQKSNSFHLKMLLE